VRLGGLEPGDPRALFYLGQTDFEAGEPRAALDRWRRLLAESPADAPWRPQVVENLRAAAKELELDPDKLLAEIPSPPAGPPAPQPSAEDVAEAAAVAPEDRMAMIRGMVDKLQARMDADGSDVEGWLRLAQSRSVLGEADRARATYEKALALHPNEPSLLKGYALLLVGPAGASSDLPRVDDRANELLTRAASLQPDDPDIWWLLGVRALQDGREDQARQAWQKVLARLDPGQPEYQSIKTRLDGLGG
jgi:cytochrome c-type biogenesis protein CcmH